MQLCANRAYYLKHPKAVSKHILQVLNLTLTTLSSVKSLFVMSLYLPAVFSDRSNHSSALCVLCVFFSSCSTVFCLSWLCCMCSPTQQLLSPPPPPPLSPLPFPNIFGLQLVCFALLPEFRLQSQNRPWLLVFPVMRRRWRGGWGGSRELIPPRHRCMIRMDPLQTQ